MIPMAAATLETVAHRAVADAGVAGVAGGLAE